MDTLLPFALLCFTSFFTLTNPLGTMPVFLTMTKGMDDEERRHIVKRATIISFITLLAFTFSGQFLFKFFGISTNGFRIAAGFIILKIGYDKDLFDDDFFRSELACFFSAGPGVDACQWKGCVAF